MNRTHRLRLVLCTLLCFVLCSCQTVLPANEKAQVEELLRAPKLSGDYGALQTALNDWLGESAQLKYPIQGELLSPFVLQDLDGDGQQDAAVLYTTAQTANVCVAILQRDDTGSWQVRQSVEGLAETVENVSLAQLQDTDSCQLVVGYTAAQNDHYLAVYSYQKGTLSTILEQQYEQYLVENITGGSSQDLILMSTQEDGSVQIELLTADRRAASGRWQSTAFLRISSPAAPRWRRARARMDGTIWCWTAGPAFPATIWPRCCCATMRIASRWCPPHGSAASGCITPLYATCLRWSAGTWTETASWRSLLSRTRRVC